LNLGQECAGLKWRMRNFLKVLNEEGLG